MLDKVFEQRAISILREWVQKGDSPDALLSDLQAFFGARKADESSPIRDFAVDLERDFRQFLSSEQAGKTTDLAVMQLEQPLQWLLRGLASVGHQIQQQFLDTFESYQSRIREQLFPLECAARPALSVVKLDLRDPDYPSDVCASIPPLRCLSTSDNEEALSAFTLATPRRINPSFPSTNASSSVTISSLHTNAYPHNAPNTSPTWFYPHLQIASCDARELVLRFSGDRLPERFEALSCFVHGADLDSSPVFQTLWKLRSLRLHPKNQPTASPLRFRYALYCSTLPEHVSSSMYKELWRDLHDYEDLLDRFVELEGLTALYFEQDTPSQSGATWSARFTWHREDGTPTEFAEAEYLRSGWQAFPVMWCGEQQLLHSRFGDIPLHTRPEHIICVEPSLPLPPHQTGHIHVVGCLAFYRTLQSSDYPLRLLCKPAQPLLDEKKERTLKRFAEENVFFDTSSFEQGRFRTIELAHRKGLDSLYSPETPKHALYLQELRAASLSVQGVSFWKRQLESILSQNDWLVEVQEGQKVPFLQGRTAAFLFVVFPSHAKKSPVPEAAFMRVWFRLRRFSWYLRERLPINQHVLFVLRSQQNSTSMLDAWLS